MKRQILPQPKNSSIVRVAPAATENTEMDFEKDQAKLILESRIKDVNELESFVNHVENNLNSLMSEFGWNKEMIQNTSKMKLCPYDKGHSIPINSFDKHVEKCALKRMGYSDEDLNKAPPSSKFYYENYPEITTVVIDKNLQSHILYEAAQKDPFSNGVEGPRGIRGNPSDLHQLEVPLTNDHAMTKLTEAERLAIYDYVVQQSKVNKKPSEVTLEDLQFSFQLQNKDKEGKPKTKLEILAELRDYKRRRQSYRAKNVHITKKSYTEVMKEVIGNMTVFMESMNEPNIEDNNQPSGSRSFSPVKIEAGRDLKQETIEPYTSSKQRYRSPSPYNRRKRSRSRNRSKSGSKSPKRQKRHSSERRSKRKSQHKHKHRHKSKKHYRSDSSDDKYKNFYDSESCAEDYYSGKQS